MPKVSSFYGIRITMYWDERHHSRPHFHARYAEYKASLDFAGEIIVGDLPIRAFRLVREWTGLHTDELSVNWELAVAEQPLNQIDPLP
jgi:hypothetical protein